MKLVTDNLTFKPEKEYFLNKLNQENIGFHVNGRDTLDHCISITLPEIDTETLIRNNEDTLFLAQGSACSSKEIEPSHVLTALGLTRELADKTFRISFALDIGKNSMNILVKAILKHS